MPVDSCRFTFDDDPLPSCIIKINGHAYIAAKYRSQLQFKPKLSLSPVAARYGLAVVMAKGFMYVNRSGKIIIDDVAEFDNGPSDFKSGVVRVNSGHKMNFAKPSGEFLFAHDFDWVSPFWKGHGYACLHCRVICRYPEAQWGECEDIDMSRVGGRWFTVTASGQSLEIRGSKIPSWTHDPGEAQSPTFHR